MCADCAHEEEHLCGTCVHGCVGAGVSAAQCGAAPGLLAGGPGPPRHAWPSCIAHPHLSLPLLFCRPINAPIRSSNTRLAPSATCAPWDAATSSSRQRTQVGGRCACCCCCAHSCRASAATAAASPCCRLLQPCRDLVRRAAAAAGLFTQPMPPIPRRPSHPIPSLPSLLQDAPTPPFCTKSWVRPSRRGPPPSTSQTQWAGACRTSSW